MTQAPCESPANAVLSRDWSFVASKPSLVCRLVRMRSVVMGLRSAPPSKALRELTARTRWNAYFCYLPDGVLTPAHRFTLSRLKSTAGGLLVVCAAPRPEEVPREIFDYADAVYWKGMSGYDFSAFSVILDAISARSPGADTLVLNDSVLGPFGDIDVLLAAARWRLTGFTASSAFENHIQSYAWYLRQVEPALVRSLRSVFPPNCAFNHFQDVVNFQETRFARVASRSMSVGALWYGDSSAAGDISIRHALPLLDAGFPFLKKSLFGGKLEHLYDQAVLRERLRGLGHPVE